MTRCRFKKPLAALVHCPPPVARRPLLVAHFLLLAACGASEPDPAVPDDIWKLSFKMHAAAHVFRRNHRLRILVASGAHPRYARNTGTDEPIGTATTLAAADIEIFHDPKHPSTITLPVFELEGIGGL